MVKYMKLYEMTNGNFDYVKGYLPCKILGSQFFSTSKYSSVKENGKNAPRRTANILHGATTQKTTICRPIRIAVKTSNPAH
jgi:hypothetical protein